MLLIQMPPRSCATKICSPHVHSTMRMGVCDEKIPVHVVDRPVVLLGQLPKQSVDPLRRQHRFSPAEEKPRYWRRKRTKATGTQTAVIQRSTFVEIDTIPVRVMRARKSGR